MQLPDHNVKEAINFAVEIADKLESEGCAPWQDAPAQPEQPAPPARREITEADVQPGAIFTDEDGETFVINSVEETEAIYGRDISLFVKSRNSYRATVTPPQKPAESLAEPE